MSHLLAVLLSFQQSDEELRALVERFNQAIRAEDPEGEGLPWNEVRRAGPAVVKHLIASFPGRHLSLVKECPSMGWEREREYPLVSLLVFAFKDHALPHLIALTRDPDPEKARIAAASQNLSENYVRLRALEVLGTSLASSNQRIYVVPTGKNGLPMYMSPFMNPFGNGLSDFGQSASTSKEDRPVQ